MTTTIHGMYISAGCRLALWAANLSDVAVEFNSVDLMKGEHKTDAYMNLTRKRHCIPCLSKTLEDGTEFAMTESRAIARYLCSQGEKVTDFPEDALKAARMNELIDYDSTCLYKRLSSIAYHRLFEMGAAPKEAAFENVRKSLDYVESRLEENEGFLVSGTLSVADIVLSNSLALIAMIPEIDVAANFPVSNKWLEHMSSLGNYGELIAPFNQFAASKLK